ncbi:ribose transport system substrate-binding protein [Microvirga flocculans]|uniref:Ribose transport system substrate-binding protein n=1 Tax=Microvirga flocculans TaxID=217168 RepID=A0A7W6IBU4_9HYPH|nr:ABC transporter substrate-binding protein [Microvirga flocculans]MBB4038514.1 ribose transport system substrate-binding protein [Microvirga flocculans]
MKATAWKIAIAAGLMAGVATGAIAQQKNVTIGVSIPAATHGWTGGAVYHAQETAKELEKAHPGLKVIVKTSPDGASQANALDDLTAQKIDALVVLPFNSDELTNPVREVKKKGVLITVIDRGLKDPTIQDIYVAGDNPGFGRIAGKYFADTLKQGNIVVLRGIPTVLDDERVTNFEKAIEGSGVKIIDKQYANWNRDDAFKVMQDFLSKHPKIDAVWAADDDMALGVLEAIRQAKREDIKFVVGGAGMKEMVKRVMDGDKMIPVNVTYPPALVATAMHVTAASFYTNAPMRGTFVLNAQLITKDNAKDHYFPNSPF